MLEKTKFIAVTAEKPSAPAWTSTWSSCLYWDFHAEHGDRDLLPKGEGDRSKTSEHDGERCPILRPLTTPPAEECLVNLDL